MSYSDIGFNEFLQRDESSSQNSSSQLDALEADTYLPELSGNKIVGGVVSSPDGRMQIDLEKGVFKVNNGIVDLVQFGVLEDGSIGFLLRNSDGKILFQFTENTQIIQSPNEHFQMNFIEEYILSKDTKGIGRALFGKGNL